jgi:hypothetical protein
MKYNVDNEYDKKHLRSLGLTEGQVEKLLDAATGDLARIAGNIKNVNPNVAFTFDDYPLAKMQADKIIKDLQKKINAAVVKGSNSAWALANDKNDKLCDLVFGDKKDKLSDEQIKRYYSNSGDALAAFLKRRVAGLNLSDRVWNYTNQYKSEIEMALDLGIRDGIPAIKMATTLQRYLKEPDRLYRQFRVRNLDKEAQHKAQWEKEHPGGTYKLQKIYDKQWKRRVYNEATGKYSFKNESPYTYHPGRGVYRSSFKNARRLASTEMNIAYHTSDHERWQQLDFVVGFEIRLSRNHPVVDICDTLNGKYPKTFKFTGWHPHCRCHTISILKTQEELDKDFDGTSDGHSVNEVTDVPKAFKSWVEEHKEGIRKAEKRGTVPYFVSDNKDFISEKPKTLADYQHIPTLKNLQPLIDDYRNSKKGDAILWETGNEDKMREIMSELFENSDFGMNVDVSVLGDILGSHFKNQFETGKSKGVFNTKRRMDASEVLFGTNVYTTKATDYEKYGYLMDKNMLKNNAQNTQFRGAARYGGVQIRFKKDKVTATFTMADSLDNVNDLKPSLTIDPKLSSFGKNTKLFDAISKGVKIETNSASEFTRSYASKSYIELQYHGKLGVDAIESIFIPHDELPDVDMAVLNEAKRKFKFDVYTKEKGKLKKIL